MNAARILRLLTDLPALRYALWLRWHRLDASPVSVADLGLDPAACHHHSHSGGPNLERVLRDLNVPRNASCLDFGSGKGIAAFTLARYFDFVMGIELSKELVEIAFNNQVRLGMRGARIWFSNNDASEFTETLDSFDYAYAFNPFPAPVLAKVAQNIVESVRRNPRRFVFVLKNPAFGHVLVEAGFWHKQTLKFKHDHDFNIYTFEV